MADPSTLQIVNVVSLRPKTEPVPSTSKEDTAITAPEREKPLLQFIRNLLNLKDNETVEKLTNSQLLDILNKEFDVNISKSHNLEIEIYLNVLKKFLKMWPRWDVFEEFVQKAKHDQHMDLEGKLNVEYQSLKLYLQTMLDVSRSGAKQAVHRAQETTKPKGIPTLTVSCTRNQLYSLFLQKPNIKNTIFNTKIRISEKIHVNKYFSLDEILNWPDTVIIVNAGALTFYYTNMREVHHYLVNKKLNEPTDPPVIPKDILTKKKGILAVDARYTDFYNAQVVLSGQIAKLNMMEQTSNVQLRINILKHIQSQLAAINLTKLSITFMYKYYLNKYAYVRHFKNKVEKNNGPNSDLYDLELEEYFSPAKTFYIEVNSVKDMANMTKETVPVWLRVTCVPCNKTFISSEIAGLKQHFNEFHCDEKDYTCINCMESFHFQTLSGLGWAHKC